MFISVVETGRKEKPSQTMIVNILNKINTRIIRRLRKTTRLSSPWRGNFSMEIPRELLDILSKKHHLVLIISYSFRMHSSQFVPA
jgi:hypothetical protein